MVPRGVSVFPTCPRPVDALRSHGPGFVRPSRSVGEGPIAATGPARYRAAMNPLLLIVILLLLFGGGGYYAGGPAYGGGGLGLIVLICLVIYLLGGLRTKR